MAFFARTRSVGYVILHCDQFQTVEAIFAQPGDLTLLGARALEGFNARVDSRRKKLVAAGPVLAAANEKLTSPKFFKHTVMGTYFGKWPDIGKCFKEKAAEHRYVQLDEDVHAEFPSTREVNDALRQLLTFRKAITQLTSPK